ncbi:MAG: Gfo/Idh/MocA family oxidoreductase, partial [Bryobacteraceae bacterium]
MLNWLVIGIGDISTKRIILAILAEPRSRLVGLVTRSADKAKVYGVRAWTSLESALQESDADAVYVATPVALHAPQTIACLQAGKHVLCEKPVAMNFAQAASMVAAADRCGRTLGIAYYRRTYPKVQRAKQLLASGAIGTPVLGEGMCHSWFQPKGEREWLLDPALAGGGPLYDIGSHRIDLLNYFFEMPIRAVGAIGNAIHQTRVEDNATGLIEYAGGVRGIVDVRWHSRVARDEFRIRGTEGELELTPLNSPDLVWPGGRELLPAHQNLHYPCIANFVGSVLDGEALLASGTSSIWTD